MAVPPGIHCVSTDPRSLSFVVFLLLEFVAVQVAHANIWLAAGGDAGLRAILGCFVAAQVAHSNIWLVAGGDAGLRAILGYFVAVQVAHANIWLAAGGDAGLRAT